MHRNEAEKNKTLADSSTLFRKEALCLHPRPSKWMLRASSLTAWMSDEALFSGSFTWTCVCKIRRHKSDAQGKVLRGSRNQHRERHREGHGLKQIRLWSPAEQTKKQESHKCSQRTEDAEARQKGGRRTELRGLQTRSNRPSPLPLH